jgi:CBS domain-containing protein
VNQRILLGLGYRFVLTSRNQSTGSDAMQAKAVMTAAVASVGPDTPRSKIAALLLEKGISAVPVVDQGGVPIGIVSEGDLIGRSDAERAACRDWWLDLSAQGETLNPGFLASLRAPERNARELMSAPAATVDAETDLHESRGCSRPIASSAPR